MPRRPEPFAGLQPFIVRFLAKDPQDRYQNAAEARQAVEKAYRFLMATAVATCCLFLWNRFSERRRRKRGWLRLLSAGVRCWLIMPTAR